MSIRPAILALLCLAAGASLHAEGRSRTPTRYGAFEAIPASGERTALLFEGTPVARMDGDASLRKLALRAERDYVLAQAILPDPACRHEFVLVEVGADAAPAISAPFGKCMTLAGARLRDGQAVVQLEEAASAPQGARRIHEFAFAGGRMQALPELLDSCRASALAAAGSAVTLGADQAAKAVAGAGRAYFHTAPLDACRTPKVFLVPGDRVAALRETDAFVEIEYRNPKSGQLFKGWVRRDRLLDPAQ